MINLIDAYKETNIGVKSIFYNIVMIGCGGNGGYTVQRLTKMMSAFTDVSASLMLSDPDIIEKKNLYRQPFIESDIGFKKADILAKRYGNTYGLKIGSYTESYVESVEQIDTLFSNTEYLHNRGQIIQDVLIGCVDNDFSRKVMNDYFNKADNLIYIDAGIEGVFIPAGVQEDWSAEEIEENTDSGYSGQVVVGFKVNGKVLLTPLNEVYPILSTDPIPPSHTCGLEPYQPQRMIANEMAAFQITAIMNELFSTNSILVHYLNFNARTGNCRPVLTDNN